MSKSLVQTVHELGALLRAHATAMTELRAALDVQFTRIAQMQAELDMLSQARKRRQSLLIQQPSHNGNGRHDRY